MRRVRRVLTTIAIGLALSALPATALTTADRLRVAIPCLPDTCSPDALHAVKGHHRAAVWLSRTLPIWYSLDWFADYPVILEASPNDRFLEIVRDHANIEAVVLQVDLRTLTSPEIEARVTDSLREQLTHLRAIRPSLQVVLSERLHGGMELQITDRQHPVRPRYFHLADFATALSRATDPVICDAILPQYVLLQPTGAPLYSPVWERQFNDSCTPMISRTSAECTARLVDGILALGRSSLILVDEVEFRNFYPYANRIQELLDDRQSTVSQMFDTSSLQQHLLPVFELAGGERIMLLYTQPTEGSHRVGDRKPLDQHPSRHPAP